MGVTKSFTIFLLKSIISSAFFDIYIFVDFKVRVVSSRAQNFILRKSQI